MSTRAIIKIEGNQAMLYKHWDGYPEAILPWLKEFYKEFYKSRGGDDPAYCLAQLVRSSVLLADKYNLDISKCTGYGIFSGYADIGQEFEYTLHANGTISVFDNHKKTTKTSKRL